MIKNKYGFTFIEIIIVVSILIMISALSIDSFGKNFEKVSLGNEVNLLNNKISKLDNDILSNITDYKIYLFTGTGGYFYYYENSLYKNINQFISINGFTGKITTNDISKNTLDLNIYINGKKNQNTSLSSTGVFEYNFSNNSDYMINSYIGSNNLNKIYLEYFSKIDKEKLIYLEEIKDELLNSYTGIIISNKIGGKRIFQTMTGALINSDLTFKFGSFSNEYNLKLTK
ncbi:MAG: type II secretion system protein [Candidatus Gracilibacteria bacterium]|nr:type II secretion system protein [Candidatus Gracilibacteria bacterium]